MATLLTLVRLWALIAASNGNCMVDQTDGPTAVLVCGFVDGPMGYDDGGGELVSVEHFPASWLGAEGRTVSQTRSAAMGLNYAGDNGGDIVLEKAPCAGAREAVDAVACCQGPGKVAQDPQDARYFFAVCGPYDGANDCDTF